MRCSLADIYMRVCQIWKVRFITGLGFCYFGVSRILFRCISIFFCRCFSGTVFCLYGMIATKYNLEGFCLSFLLLLFFSLSLLFCLFLFCVCLFSLAYSFTTTSINTAINTALAVLMHICETAIATTVFFF